MSDAADYIGEVLWAEIEATGPLPGPCVVWAAVLGDGWVILDPHGREVATAVTSDVAMLIARVLTVGARAQGAFDVAGRALP